MQKRFVILISCIALCMCFDFFLKFSCTVWMSSRRWLTNETLANEFPWWFITLGKRSIQSPLKYTILIHLYVTLLNYTEMGTFVFVHSFTVSINITSIYNINKLFIIKPIQCSVSSQHSHSEKKHNWTEKVRN